MGNSSRGVAHLCAYDRNVCIAACYLFINVVATSCPPCAMALSRSLTASRQAVLPRRESAGIGCGWTAARPPIRRQPLVGMKVRFANLHHAVSRRATAFATRKALRYCTFAQRICQARSRVDGGEPPIRHQPSVGRKVCAKPFPRGVPKGHRFHHKKSPARLRRAFLVVGAGGFGPPKALPADLQSVPFGHSGTLPYLT